MSPLPQTPNSSGPLSPSALKSEKRASSPAAQIKVRRGSTVGSDQRAVIDRCDVTPVQSQPKESGGEKCELRVYEGKNTRITSSAGSSRSERMEIWKLLKQRSALRPALFTVN